MPEEKDGKESRPTGRPTLYTDELAKEICEAITQSSRGLNVLCQENEHWPHQVTVRRWISSKLGFRNMYAEAKLKQADAMVEEIIEKSKDESRDFLIKYDESGNQFMVGNSTAVARDKLIIDTLKWVAAKYAPRIYGDTGKDEKTNSEALLEKIIEKL